MFHHVSRWAALVATVAIVVSACSGTATPAPTAAPVATSAPVATAAPTAAPVVTAAPVATPAPTAAPVATPAPTAAALTKVSVQLDFVLSAAYGALMWGKDKGYFAQNGIDLDLIPGQGTDLALQQINSAAVNFAIVDVGNYLQQRIQNQTETTAVYVQFPIGTTGIMSIGNEIKTPQDMAGKTFCTVAQSSGRTKIPQILHQNNVAWDESKLLDLMDFSVLYPTLFQGAGGGCDTAESGLAGSWEGAEAKAKAQGLTPYFTPISDWGYKDYSKMLIVRNDTIANNPELVKNFVSAFYKSQQDAYANASSDDIYNPLVKLDPQSDQATTNAVWTDVVKYGTGFGAIDPSVIQYQMDLLKNSNPPVTTTLTPDKFFDNQFIPTN